MSVSLLVVDDEAEFSRPVPAAFPSRSAPEYLCAALRRFG